MARRAVIMLVRAMRKTVLGGTKSLIVAPPRRVLVSFGELLTGHCQLRPKPATSSGKRVLTSPKGATVELSGAEYDLLTVFLDHSKRALSRERLLELARNRVSVSATDRSVDVQVSRLRQKLEVQGESRSIIKTVRGVGYVLTADIEP